MPFQLARKSLPGRGGVCPGTPTCATAGRAGFRDTLVATHGLINEQIPFQTDFAKVVRPERHSRTRTTKRATASPSRVSSPRFMIYNTM